MEVKFEDDKQGKVQVVASPLVRLTNKPNASIEEIGSPEKVIASLGPFVTGNTLDPDELLEASVEKLGDQTVFPFCLLIMLSHKRHFDRFWFSVSSSSVTLKDVQTSVLEIACHGSFCSLVNASFI